MATLGWVLLGAILGVVFTITIVIALIVNAFLGSRLNR